MKAITLLPLVLFLAACGNTKRNADSSSAPAGATTPPPPAATGKCVNPIGVTDVPREWEPVQAEKLTDGSEGQWELRQVRLHGRLEMDGKIYTALGVTNVTQTGGTPSFLSSVACKDLEDETELSLSAGPHLSINRATGEAQRNVTVKYVLSGNSQKLASQTGLLPAGTRLGADRDSEEAQHREIRAKGGEVQAAFYKIGANEFELRAMVKMPNRNGPGSLTLHVANRYRLGIAK